MTINFNHDGNWDKEPQRGGLTMRAYLAGQALVALATYGCSHEVIAAQAVAQADALITALNQPKP